MAITRGIKSSSARVFSLLVLFAVSLIACSSSDDGQPVFNDDQPVQPVTNSPPTVGDPASIPQNQTGTITPTEQVYPFRPDGRYASALKDCVLVNTVAASCSMLTLPLIGQEYLNPGVEQVLERVLVTHDWMGERFERLLNDAPADLLHLFSSTTAILIGSEVRPSFYSTLNGAIQLDPVYLWLTVPEKRSISVADDFRRDFGADLIFVADWEWMLGDQRATRSFSLQDNSERAYQDIVYPIMGLLYHELAHANDYVADELRPGFDVGQSIYEAISGVIDIRRSVQLQAVYPLLDAEMVSLAQVRYRDNMPTDREPTLPADFVGSLMDNDGATTFYSYLTDREDLANLLTTTMMSLHYGISQNVGFEIKPVNPTSCADYVVGWGMRNRLADPQVLPRARWVTETLVGRSDSLDAFFNAGVGSTTLMRVGEDWCSNRVTNPVSSKDVSAGAGGSGGSSEQYVPNLGHHIH